MLRDKFFHLIVNMRPSYAYVSAIKTKCTGCFIMFSVITNVYNKTTEGSTLIKLFTATGKLKKFFCFTTTDFGSVHHG
jgi:hypothetical protein